MTKNWNTKEMDKIFTSLASSIQSNLAVFTGYCAPQESFLNLLSALDPAKKWQYWWWVKKVVQWIRHHLLSNSLRQIPWAELFWKYTWKHKQIPYRLVLVILFQMIIWGRDSTSKGLVKTMVWFLKFPRNVEVKRFLCLLCRPLFLYMALPMIMLLEQIQTF